MERITRRLGATAVPLLGRELRGGHSGCREVARDALAVLATTTARARVIHELRNVTLDESADEAKVCALGLLAELGEHAAARFADPSAIQRRSALALAAQLDTPSDVASAADMMVRQLDDDDVLQMIEVLLDAAPHAAHRLGTELVHRLDLEPAQRDAIAALLASADPVLPVTRATPPRRTPRPTRASVLVDAAARVVVVATRKVSGERRWRRWAVLISATGRIDDCLHDDAADDGEQSLIRTLCTDGYRVASTDLDHARSIVAAAVRITASEPSRLSSAYYVGRDLLDLADTHVLRRGDHGSTLVGRAVELLAAGDRPRARALLDRVEPANAGPDHDAALAACHVADGNPTAAIAPLERAITAEPAWPLHHWNLATVLHQLGDQVGCYHALRRFVATSGSPTALYGDRDQPGRVACAERMIAEIERSARLTGTSLTRRRAKKSPARR
ncbi:MAG TPA: hypothetical protein VFQ53_41725 [Kofleriaceae bacterium]|nr:hypothetical protein [Kofleriaceae bacterium]